MQYGADLMLKRLAKDANGLALIEFAFALPVLLVLYLGGYAVSDLVSCNRKVAIATESPADLVSRTVSPAIIYNAPQSADATSDLSASAVVLSPYKLNNATEQISLLRVCDATHAYVVWTQAQTQSADGTTITSTQSTQTAGTLPANQAQSASSVVSIPGNMVTLPIIPISPDGSDVCTNLAPSTSLKTQVGTAGGFIYMGRVSYAYTPSIVYYSFGTTVLSSTIYMSPRLY